MDFKGLDKELQKIMGKGGQKFLDDQIMKMAADMDQRDFKQFAQQFFAQHNVNMKDFLPANMKFKKPEPEPSPPSDDPEDTDLPDDINQEQSHYEVSKQKIQGKDKHFKVTYNNGDEYVGEMENNQKSGFGIYKYANGQLYDGMFIEDDIHGYGKYTFMSGAQYEGEWYEGNKHGFGTLKFPNKDMYVGQFKRDLMHGKGKYNYSNGDVFQGEWKEGKKNGRGKFDGTDGRLIIGQWKNDVFSP